MDLSYFYKKDADGDVILDINNTPVERERVTKTVAALKSHISLGSSDAVINRICNGIIELGKWEFFDAYTSYLAKHLAWSTSSDNFVAVRLDDDSFSTFNLVEPIAPVRPADQTKEEILAPYWGARRAAIMQGAKITTTLGNQYNADELSVNRLTMAKVSLEGELDSIEIPWSLANTATGVMSIVTLGDLREAQLLAATNMSANWSI